MILQANEFMDGHLTVLTCPFTSFIADAPLIRPTIEPSPQNGLSVLSQVMVDKTTPARRDAIGAVIGHISAADLLRVEAALINITGLRQPVPPLPISRSGKDERNP